MRKIEDINKRFFKHVIKNGDNECWIWKGATNPAGYGRFKSVDNKRGYAHRFSYELVHGKIPEKMHICHTCDNPSCVNPNHLWLGTAKQNNADMMAKGRRGKRTVNINGYFKIILKGSIHPLAKLNEEQAKEIKIKLKNGIKGTIIAREYNVSDQLIYLIKKGISWKHVII